MTKDVERRIAELARMSDIRLRTEHFKVFGWEPLLLGRRAMIERLSTYLRAQPDSTTDTDEKE